MINLNFPAYDFRLREVSGKKQIFDPVRKKYVALTPEEWVRQHVIQYMVNEKSIPATLIRVESEIRLFQTKKRFDIAVFDRNGNALMVVECKAPAIALTQKELDQAIRYNLALKVKYVWLTNGIQHFICKAGPDQGLMNLVGSFPDFNSMTEEA